MAKKRTSNYRGSRGWAARKTDQTYEDTFNRMKAMFDAAKAMAAERIAAAQKEQASRPVQTNSQDGANQAGLFPGQVTDVPSQDLHQQAGLPSLNFDDDDDPQAEGTAELNRLEMGLSPWWSDKLF